jgi:hypothetical protein
MPVIVVTGSFRICSDMGHRKYSGISISAMIINNNKLKKKNPKELTS